MKYEPRKIRNVVLVGHNGAGKTSLAEAALFVSGAISRLGRVEDKNTVCDYDPEETKRGFSISLALAPVEWQGHKINFIDTPGSPDFEGEAIAGLHAADAACFVVSAVDGPQVQTRYYWKLAKEMGLPAFFFVNKLDKERASLAVAVEELRKVFGNDVVPLQAQIGAESDLAGLFDLYSRKSFRYSLPNPRGEAADLDAPEEAEAARDSLLEGIAESDEALLDSYLERGDLDEKEFEQGLAKAVASRSLFPVIGGASTAPIGVDLLLDFVCSFVPSPLDQPEIQGESVTNPGEKISLQRAADGPFVAQVFKTIADPFVGKLSVFRVLTGSAATDTAVINTTRSTEEKLHQVFALRGKEHLELEAVVAGDIAAVAKLQATKTGDTLASKGADIVLSPIQFPEPVFSLAVAPKAKGDEDKLSQGLQRLAEEDPTIRLEHNTDTRQLIVSGLGEAHLLSVVEKLKRKFGVDVETSTPKVSYRETITKPSQGEGKHKKQTGGHGQFGVAVIKIEPLPRDAGFEFVDQIVGGAIPKQFIPAVEKGVREAMERGFYAGYPLVDLKVTLFDGKHHPVDSSELSFKMAGSLALQAALPNAGVVLLEPIMDLEVVVPDDKVGDVQGDLNSKRGRILGTEPGEEGFTVITAKVPQAELLRYSVDLRSITGGQGRFKVRFSHYEEVPPHIAEKVKAEAAG
jgi:elongation factor G